MLPRHLRCDLIGSKKLPFTPAVLSQATSWLSSDDKAHPLRQSIH